MRSLLRDGHALRGVRVIFADEGVTAWIERPQPHGALSPFVAWTSTSRWTAFGPIAAPFGIGAISMPSR